MIYEIKTRHLNANLELRGARLVDTVKLLF